MSLRSRLVLVVASILGIVVLAGAVGTGLVAERDRDNARLRDLAAARRRVDELTTTYTDQQNAIVNYLVLPQRFVIEPYRAGIPVSSRLLRELRGELRPYRTLQRNIDVIDTDAKWLRQQAVDPAIRLLQSGRSKDAVLSILRPEVRTRYDHLRAGLTTVGRGVDRASRQATHRRNTANWWLVVTLVATAVLVVVAMVVGAVLIGRWTTRPIGQIAAAVRAVREGALDTRVPAAGPPDLAALGEDVDQMRARIIRELSETVRAREALEQNATVVLTLRQLLEPDLAALPDGWRVAARLRPTEGVVAGDSYDVGVLPDGRVSLVVIDIAGHGAVSAIAALRCQELLRAGLADGRAPGEALGWLHEQIREPGVELFFSAFVATVDPATGRCSYANAGHPSALLGHGTTVTELGRTGPIVGPMVTDWKSAHVTIEPGDTLAVYTDGFTDPRNQDGGDSALGVLTRMLRQPDPPDADTIVSLSLDELDAHAPGRPRDDVTLVVLSRTAATAANAEAAPAVTT
jgi:serine phosphatase RsbU (regulator of sigma subunit)/CHASE3 domain sensor protein